MEFNVWAKLVIMIALAGGNSYNYRTRGGFFAWQLSFSASIQYWSQGARLLNRY